MYVLNAISSDLERQAHTANQSAKLVLALFGFNTNDNLLPDLLIASYFHWLTNDVCSRKSQKNRFE